MLKTLNNDNFENETKTGLKLIEFYTTWCGYCKKQAEILKEMDKIWIGQIDADENPEIAIKHGIHSFPTFLVLNNGKEMERFSGLKSKFDLMNIISKYL